MTFSFQTCNEGVILCITIGVVHQFIGHCLISLDPWFSINIKFRSTTRHRRASKTFTNSCAVQQLGSQVSTTNSNAATANTAASTAATTASSAAAATSAATAANTTTTNAETTQ